MRHPNRMIGSGTHRGRRRKRSVASYDPFTGSAVGKTVGTTVAQTGSPETVA
jgi:hypothetical protein